MYASGLNPGAPEKLAGEKLAESYRAFKLKVGFGVERDTANLKALRGVIGDRPLMVDANQAWDLETATGMAAAFEDFNLAWLEEPLRADRPWSEWQQLAMDTATGLGAGENMAAFNVFERALESHALAVVQPDMAKWGGFTGCLPVELIDRRDSIHRIRRPSHSASRYGLNSIVPQCTDWQFN